MAPSWRLVFDGTGRPGPDNMALDWALLDDAARTGAATLRLYRWAPATLSFGRNEPAAARYHRAAIERLGIPVVRRPTGGRAVWHAAELTYAVAAPVAAFGSLAASYRAIHERLVAALRGLGVPAELATPERATAGQRGGSCFATAVGGEVLAGGRKLVGSAQVRRDGAFLQHGSLLLDGNQDLVARVSRRPAPPARAVTLREVLGRPVGFDEAAAAIVAAWQPTPWSSEPVPTPTIVRDHFADPDWTWRR